jgi:hypothetical protein
MYQWLDRAPTGRNEEAGATTSTRGARRRPSTRTIPAVLKNAIDSVFASFAFRNKPAGAVAYSGEAVAGARAVAHLAQIAIEAEMVPLRNTVLIGTVQNAVGPDGHPVNRMTSAALSILLDDLAWWAKALANARSAGQLQPGGMRLIAARSAASS